MSGLFVIFVAVPALELYLLLQLGTAIGPLNTFLCILVTGILGASLVRNQGLSVLQQLHSESQQGRVPAQQLVEGLMLLVAGALLLTPGFLTDTIGFLTLLPPLRQWAARRWAQQLVVVTTNSTHFAAWGASGKRTPKNPTPTVIDVEATEVKDPEFPRRD